MATSNSPPPSDGDRRFVDVHVIANAAGRRCRTIRESRFRPGSPFVASLPFHNFDGLEETATTARVTVSCGARLVISVASLHEDGAVLGTAAPTVRGLFFRLASDDDDDDSWACLCDFSTGGTTTATACVSGLGIEATGPHVLEFEARARGGGPATWGRGIHLFGSVLPAVTGVGSGTGGGTTTTAASDGGDEKVTVEALDGGPTGDSLKNRKRKAMGENNGNDETKGKNGGAEENGGGLLTVNSPSTKNEDYGDDPPPKKLTKKQRKRMAGKKAKELEETLSQARRRAVATLPGNDDGEEKMIEGGRASDRTKKVKKIEDKTPLARERRLWGGISIRDVVVGKGLHAKSGRKVSIRYVGRLASTGEIFDENMSEGSRPPLAFRPGTGEVIRGLERGIEGMKVGGERTVAVPALLGYGSKGSVDKVPPNAALNFEVKLLSVG